MERRKEKIILLVLVLVLFIVNYQFLDSSLEDFILRGQSEKVLVERVIDGDTIESNGTSIRLLGINTPERGELFYIEAKNYLESLILNETVSLEFVGERQDKYFRTLAYVFFEGENINVKMVEEGFGNYYFYDGRDKYSDELEKVWDLCLSRGVNLCEPSQHLCRECISINSEGFIVNSCSFSCDINGWEIKGEGRAKFVFSGELREGERKGFDLDLSSSGGSLFLRDGVGGLVLFKD